MSPLQPTRAWRAIATVLIALALVLPARAAFAQASEYAVKVGFLYNFLVFAEWPAGSQVETSDKAHVCIIGRDPFGAALKQLEARSVRSKSIETVVSATGTDMRTCHLVFFPADLPEAVAARALASLKPGGVLIVSEAEPPVHAQAAVRLSVQGGKVGFSVELAALAQQGVRLDSRVLKIARGVK